MGEASQEEVRAMLRRIAIGVVLALLMALPVGAQDFEKGVAKEEAK